MSTNFRDEPDSDDRRDGDNSKVIGRHIVEMILEHLKEVHSPVSQTPDIRSIQSHDRGRDGQNCLIASCFSETETSASVHPIQSGAPVSDDACARIGKSRRTPKAIAPKRLSARDSRTPRGRLRRTHEMSRTPTVRELVDVQVQENLIDLSGFPNRGRLSWPDIPYPFTRRAKVPHADLGRRRSIPAKGSRSGPIYRDSLCRP